MRESRYIYLILVAIVAMIVAVLAARSRAPLTESSAQAAVMPGLSAAVNDVTSITAKGAGDVVLVTLEKDDVAWTVAQKGGYPADPSKVRKFLLDLADARLVEQKTSRAENYTKLGVEAVSGADASGVRIELAGVSDAPAVILGKTTRGGNAVYVRLADKAETWVADKNLNFVKDSSGWLNKDVIDVNSARINKVSIRHPDGKTVEAARGAVNFELADTPDGKALSSPAAANSLANVLDGLRFEDVLALASFDAGEQAPVEVTYATVEGLIVEARAYTRDEEFFASFTSRFDAAAVEPLPDSSAQDDTATDTGAPDAAEAISAESERINARVGGWVYKIPRYKYDQMTRTVDDFVTDET